MLCTTTTIMSTLRRMKESKSIQDTPPPSTLQFSFLPPLTLSLAHSPSLSPSPSSSFSFLFSRSLFLSPSFSFSLFSFFVFVSLFASKLKHERRKNSQAIYRPTPPERPSSPFELLLAVRTAAERIGGFLFCGKRIISPSLLVL